MDENRTRAAARVKAVAEALTKMDQFPFRDVLSSADVEAAFLEHGVDFRDRVYPPDTTLFAFLSQRLNANHSLKGAVSRINAERIAAGKGEIHPNTGDYAKSWQRLPVEVVMSLAKQAAQKMEAEIPDAWKWKGLYTKLMDGSTILMADSEENQEAYPQHGSQKKGVGFPIARLVAIMSLATGAVFDAAMGPFKGKGTGELALARKILESLVCGDVLVVDRYYCSYFFIALPLQADVNIVTRSHGARQTDFRSGRHNAKGDHTISLQKPQRPTWMDQETYDAMPDAIILREVKTKLAIPGYRAEDLVVVTSLVDARRFKVEELSLLYDRRWHVELDLRAIKSTLGMDMLNCKSPVMVEKEMWVGFLAYNLIRKIMAQAASVSNLNPRKLSFSGAVQAFSAFSKLWSENAQETNARLYLAMISQISKERVGNRPGRRELRAVKRRPKPFPRLTKPRAQARAALG